MKNTIVQIPNLLYNAKTPLYKAKNPSCYTIFLRQSNGLEYIFFPLELMYLVFTTSIGEEAKVAASPAARELIR